MPKVDPLTRCATCRNRISDATRHPRQKFHCIEHGDALEKRQLANLRHHAALRLATGQEGAR